MSAVAAGQGRSPLGIKGTPTGGRCPDNPVSSAALHRAGCRGKDRRGVHGAFDRQVSYAALKVRSRVLDQYATPSLHSGDYKDITDHASYTLTILDLLRRSAIDGTVACA